MKKVIFFAATVFSLNAAGQNAKADSITASPFLHDSTYCAEIKDGSLILSSAGKVLATDVILANGTTITANGTIKAKDGVLTKMEIGQCVDLSKATAIVPTKNRTTKSEPVGSK